MTNMHDQALAYLDQARAALTDVSPGQDPRAALIESRRCIRIADQALADLMTATPQSDEGTLTP